MYIVHSRLDLVKVSLQLISSASTLVWLGGAQIFIHFHLVSLQKTMMRDYDDCLVNVFMVVCEIPSGYPGCAVPQVGHVSHSLFNVSQQSLVYIPVCQEIIVLVLWIPLNTFPENKDL